ncbi:MAG: tetratricopeptide repeat protein [Prevotellaceae bacterium]|nr:tetratricopeptide repeat protein [Prevotellaceae bacterium]
MRKVLSFMLLLCAVQGSVAQQAPKWVEKAKRAVFSVVSYDANDKILNTGNGFFVSEDGVALSDYSLLKGASRAVAVTSDGEKMPVLLILGANDMYDVVKFRVGTSGKKVTALSAATVAAAAGTQAYVLPYSTQKERAFTPCTVREADRFSDGYSYYTLELSLADKMVSCPLMNEAGEVLALTQKSSGKDTATICYGVDANYAMAQGIGAFSFNDRTLEAIGIKKALPDTEEQALVFLLMSSTQVSAEKYTGYLDDFIATYPGSAEGYIRRASYNMNLSKDEASMDKVSADMERALSLANDNDDVYYSCAKLIYSYVLASPDKPYKDWSLDKALELTERAAAIQNLPAYVQSIGDIYFAKGDYAAALPYYEQVNGTILASAATYFSTARTKELLEAPQEEVVALMDSCVARLNQPYTEESAPYLLERARVLMDAGQAREAMKDYDAYDKAMGGRVSDLFYYYRSQAALQARQYQRALDDMQAAIEANPDDLTYYAELAVINLRVGRGEEALTVLDKALGKDENYAEAYRLRGLARVQMKQNKEACADFAKAKELGDENADECIQKYCN